MNAKTITLEFITEAEAEAFLSAVNHITEGFSCEKAEKLADVTRTIAIIEIGKD